MLFHAPGKSFARLTLVRGRSLDPSQMIFLIDMIQYFLIWFLICIFYPCFPSLVDGNYEIGVHIADVSHFVRPNTALDQVAGVSP